MKTVSDNIAEAGASLLDGVRELLGPSAPLENINKPQSDVVFIGPSFAFPELSKEGRRLRSRLNGECARFFALVRALLRPQSAEVLSLVDECEETIREAIQQEHLVWHRTTGEAFAAVDKALAGVLEDVGDLYDSAEGSVVLVPDTNALIFSPAFQNWVFEGIPEFEVLLVPMLLAELDGLKTDHRNPDVREKAQAVIRQVKEYSRRGPLTDGVPIVADRIRLRSLAVEPRVDETLSWLDATVPDDRILASMVEAMRAHPRSVVALVTGDINLQNKARFAGVPFVEPPGSQ